jgi:hypothetical protein
MFIIGQYVPEWVLDLRSLVGACACSAERWIRWSSYGWDQVPLTGSALDIGIGSDLEHCCYLRLPRVRGMAASATAASNIGGVAASTSGIVAAAAGA